MGALEELLKVVVSDDEGDREADGTPQAVPTADPIPELEHVLRGDAKLGRGGDVGAERDEMFRDVRLVLGVIEEPRAGGVGVGDGLLGGERLAGDDEQGAFGIAEAEGLREVGAVDVGDKVRGKIALGVRLEGLGDHHGAEIGSADADVDDGGDGFSGVARPGCPIGRRRRIGACARGRRGHRRHRVH